MSNDNDTQDETRESSESSVTLSVRGFHGLGVLLRLAAGLGAIAALSIGLDWSPEQTLAALGLYGGGALATADRKHKETT